MSSGRSLRLVEKKKKKKIIYGNLNIKKMCAVFI